MYHCVYCITEISSNMQYIGSHTSHILPHDDIGINYFSSSTNHDFIQSQKDHPHNYIYKILSTHDNYADALKEEARLHHLYNVDISHLYYNKVKANPYFDVHNMIAVIRRDDPLRTIIWVDRNDKDVLNGTLVGCNYGTVTVRNIITGLYEKINKDEYDPSIHEYNMSGKMVGYNNNGDIEVSSKHDLVSIHKGTVNIKDDNGYRRVDVQTRIELDLKCVLDDHIIMRNKHTGLVEMIDKDADRSIYEGVNKHKVTVKDINGFCKVVSKDDPDYLSSKLTHITKGKMNVKDINGNVYKVFVDDPRVENGELVPYMSGFIWITNGDINKYIPQNSIIPPGWYRGMKKSRNRKGSTGKIWITNGIESKLISKSDSIEEGWFKGRKLK